MSEQFTIEEDSLWHDMLRFVGERPTTNQEANRLSVLKWQMRLDHLKKTGKLAKSYENETCGYCMLHIRYSCAHCPVKKATKKQYCYGSPYEQYQNTADRSTQTMIDICEREIAFLKSLEPTLWKEQSDDNHN